VDNANRVFVARDGALFNKAFTELIMYPAGKTGSSYAVPEGVTRIGNNAFSGCGSLTSVTLPACLTSNVDNSYSVISTLTNVSLPAGLTSIGDWAFSVCESLTSVTLPAGLTSIGDYAFSWCGRLASVTLPALTPPALGGSLWYWGESTVIYVPAAAVDAYKNAAGWKDYANKIQAIKQ
jgi:hypothetical protein